MDIWLVDGVPIVLQALSAIQPMFVIGQIYLAGEFKVHNSRRTQTQFIAAMGSIPLTYMPHPEIKLLVPQAVGLIRTADTTPYPNMILVSALDIQ